LLGLFIYSTFSMRKKLRFDLTFIYTVKTGGEEWWSPITDQIILGGIPLESHSEQLYQNKVTHILTLLESFELTAGLVTPLRKETMRQFKIDNKVFACQDFSGVPVEIIHEAVEYLHSAVSQQGQKIYVHCKAGRGRSATIIVAYLLKYGFKDRCFERFEEAYAFVKSKRAKVNLKQHQQKTIEDYYHKYIALPNPD